MPRYGVRMPVTGAIYTEVEAENEEDAITKALECEGLTNADIEEWEAHRHVNRGNVWHGPLGEADAELIADDEPA